MEKLKPTVTLFFDTRRAKKNDTYPVKLTIYFNGDKERYSANMDLTKEHWGKVNSDKLRDDYLKIQKRKLNALTDKAQKIIDTLEVFSFEAFETAFFNKKVERGTLSLEKSFDAYTEALESAGRIGTATSYNTAKNSLIAFRSKLQLTDITTRFLSEYESHMRSNGASASTIGIYLRSLRAIVNKAINDRIIKTENYPFKTYQIPSSRNIKKALSDEELKKVLQYKPLLPQQQKALDFWTLTYLCNGINMTDLLMLKHSSIDKDFFHFYRAKTINTKKKDLRPIKVYVTSSAKEIIRKWQSAGRDNDYLFPILENGLTPRQIKQRIQGFLKIVNKNMKAIGKDLEIEKPLGTYCARHTHATVLKRKGVPTAAIAENLGHSSLLTTENYLDSFTDDVKREYSKLLTTF